MIYLDLQIDSHHVDTAFYYSVKQNDWGVMTFRCYVTNKFKPLDFTGWKGTLAVRLPNKQVITIPAVSHEYDKSIVNFQLTEKATEILGDIECQIVFERGTEGKEGYGRCTIPPTFKIKIEKQQFNQRDYLEVRM